MNESKSNQNKSETIVEIAKALSLFQSKFVLWISFMRNRLKR